MQRIQRFLLESWKGAALGHTIVVLLIGAVIGSTLSTGLPLILDIPLGMLLAFLALALVDLIFKIAGKIGNGFPRILKSTFVGGNYLSYIASQSIH